MDVMIRKVLASAMLVLSAVPGARADDRLGIRPGMSFAEADAVLKLRCKEYVVTGDTEKFITCHLDDQAAGAVVTATVTAKDRIYYIAWREMSDNEVMGYTQQVATDLGFRGEGKTCKFYDYELRCWTGQGGTVLYAGERDAQKRYVTYLINEVIEKEDTGQ